MNIIFEIKKRLTPYEACKRYYTTKINRNTINCFMHEEKTPSMHIYKERFHCFGCNRSADIVDLVRIINRTDTAGAIKILANDLGVDFEKQYKEVTSLQEAMTLEAELERENAGYFKLKSGERYIDLNLENKLKSVEKSNVATMDFKRKMKTLLNYWAGLDKHEKLKKTRFLRFFKGEGFDEAILDDLAEIVEIKNKKRLLIDGNQYRLGGGQTMEKDRQKKCSDCGREIKKGEWYVKTEDEIHCKLCCYDYSLESKL